MIRLRPIGRLRLQPPLSPKVIIARTSILGTESQRRHDHVQEYRDHAFSRVRGGKLHHPLRDLTAESARMGDSEQFIAKRAAFRAYHLRLNGYPRDRKSVV